MGVGPLLAAFWRLAAPMAPQAPGTQVVVRLGPPQRAARLELSCPAGLVLFDAEGVPLLADAPALCIRVGTIPQPTPPTDASAPEAPRPLDSEGSDGQPPGSPPAPAPARATRIEPAHPPAEPADPPEVPNPKSQIPDPKSLALIVEYGPAGATESTLALPLAALEVRPMDPEVPVTVWAPDERRQTHLRRGTGRRLRGGISLQPEPGGRLRILNVLSLEDYVRGVLPAEMSPSAPFEALKAQAVVARTYAVACRARHAAEGYDLCAGEHCQVYAGPGRESVLTDEAVRATEGQVLLHDGRPISAFFHAACGGATDSPADVWGASRGAPYLASVPDYAASPDEEVGAEASILSLAVRSADVFCGDARQFHWELERTREELERTLARTLPAVLGKRVTLGDLRALSVAARSPGGRVVELRVEGTGGVFTVRGDSIRRLFRGAGAKGNGLPSTRFVLRTAEDPGPKSEIPNPKSQIRYRFLGFGHGHGIGLCQSGAIGMARRGKIVAEILGHYYPGTTLARAAGATP